MEATARPVDDPLKGFVDRYRAQCLWFLRPDYYPATHEAQLRVLDLIQRYGDREAHVQAATIRQWLLQHSSAGSATS